MRYRWRQVQKIEPLPEGEEVVCTLNCGHTFTHPQQHAYVGATFHCDECARNLAKTQQYQHWYYENVVKKKRQGHS